MTTWNKVYHQNLLLALSSGATELVNHTFQIAGTDNLVESIARGFRHEFSDVMYNWTIAGEMVITDEMIAMNPNAAKFQTVFEVNAEDGGGVVCTAYGPRILAQLNYVVGELQRDPNSRRANIMILGAHDRHVGRALGHGETKCEYICTNGFNFRIRNGALDMHTSMRSNNYATTVCQDVYVFTRLQAHIAEMMELDVGTYYHHAMSGHILEHERSRAVVILEEFFSKFPEEKPSNWSTLVNRYAEFEDSNTEVSDGETSA